MNHGWAALAAALICGTAAVAQEHRPIAVGETLSGELRPGDRKADDDSLYDVYVFKGQAGQRVAISLRSAVFDAYLHLYGGDRELRTDDDGGGGSNARINVTLPETGDYVIWANGQGPGDSGAYDLELEQTAAQAPASAAVNRIRLGQALSGALSDGDARADDDSYYDLYRFRGEAGERIVVRLGSDAFDTYVAIHRAGLSPELATNDDRAEDDTNSEVVFTLPATGEYDIWANSLARDRTGAYRLSLVRASASAGGQPKALKFDRLTRGRLAPGDPKAGDDSYYDLYRFRGAAGQTVTVTMTSEAFNSYLSVHRKGEIKELATNDDDPQGAPHSVLAFTLPAAGEYDVWANSRDGGETGDYTIRLIGDSPSQPRPRR